MIKCDNCQTKISLEDLRCPNCKHINKVAEEHYKELAFYDRKYERALANVYRQNSDYKWFHRRILICGLLSVALFISLLFKLSPEQFVNDVFSKKNENYYYDHAQTKDMFLSHHEFEKYYAYKENAEYRIGYEHDHVFIDRGVDDYTNILKILSYDYIYSSEYLSSYFDSFAQCHEVLLFIKEANDSMKPVDTLRLDQIFAGASKVAIPSEDSLTTQLEAFAYMKGQLLNSLCYHYGITLEEANEIWNLPRHERNVAITKLTEKEEQ